jgi:cell division septation protein DedD
MDSLFIIKAFLVYNFKSSNKKMKKCPQCNRNYSDETLNFCLEDGTVLTSISDRSTDENILRKTEQPTEMLTYDQVTEAIQTDKKTEEFENESATVVKSQRFSNDSQPQIIKQGVSPMFAYLTVGLLAILVLIAGVGITFWINSNSNSDSNSEVTQSNTNSITSNLSVNDLGGNETNAANDVTETEKSAQKNTPAIEKKETPKKDKTPVETNPNPTPTETATATPTPNSTETPESEKGRYYVILGSYQDSANAKRRLQLARSKGLPARIINTSNVPGLRSGLQAVVLGPFSKSEAQRVLRRAKSVSSDAYVKAG